VAHALDRGAIENYFPDAVIKREFGTQYQALEAYKKLEDVNPHRGKSQNCKIAAGMSFDDIKNTDLGQFLMQL
jgi:hypothetical protein